MALLLAPTGAVVGAEMQTQGTAVEQHTTFVPLIVQEDDGDDEQGFAAVAGIVACEAGGAMQNAVLWFNDQILLRQGDPGPRTDCLDDKESTHVWLTEEDAPDPRDNPSLKATGNVFEFTDPNGQAWTVREFVYHQIHVHRSSSTQASVGDVSAGYDAEGEVRAVPHYTWVVETSEPILDPTIEQHYNFVNIVDFSRLQHGTDGHRVHDGSPGSPERGNSHNASAAEENHTFPHAHDTVDVELRLGGAPEEGPGSPFENGARADARVHHPEPSFEHGSAGPSGVR